MLKQNLTCSAISFLHVDIDKIKQNYTNIIKSMISGQVKIIAMVKSNAYGHGIIQTSLALENEKVDYLGVFSLQEAFQLRKNKLISPILIFGIPHRDELSSVDQLKATLVVSSPDELDDIIQWADYSKKTIRIHLKVDTGMGRLGFFCDDALKTIKSISKNYPSIEIEGLCTHFSESSSNDKSYTLYQGDLFNRLLRSLEKEKITIPLIHAANSGAIIRYPEFHYTAIRPGILLYGISPDETKINGLSPVLSLYSQVRGIKTLQKGSFISYGRTYQTKKTTKIAIIPLGYADGIPLTLSNSGMVIIQNHLCPILGAVCMNQFMVDISDAPEVAIDDQVILIGSSEHHTLSIRDVAKHANTLPYDILCRLSILSDRTYSGL